MDENIQGKYFSITDPENVNTVIYQVNRTEDKIINYMDKAIGQFLDNMEKKNF